MLFCSMALNVLAAEAPFVPGEKIHYSVRQLGVKAGDAVLEFKGDAYLEGRKSTLIVFTAKGFNFYDEERIYVDPVSFFPFKVMRDLNIFGNKENIMEEYFPAEGFIRVTRTFHGETTVKDIRKSGVVDNIYGFLYRVRQQDDMSVGKKLDLRLPTVDLKLEAVSEVKFNAMGKTYQSVMMKSVPAKYTLWFDPGPQRLPLRIAGALGMSNTVMVMTGYEAK